MKIKRKNRIINTNTDNVGLIFISSQCIINNKKKINLNKTKLYHKDNNFITTVKFKNWKKTLNSIIDKKNVYSIIDIYKNKLFIVNINYDYELESYKSKRYLDLFQCISDSVYNDIYFYNKKFSNCYLNTVLKDSDNVYQLTLKDLYYYLIGYI